MTNEEENLQEAKEQSSLLNTLFGMAADFEDLFLSDKDPMETSGWPDEPEVYLEGVEFQWDDSDPSYSGIPLQSIGTGWKPGDRTPVAYSINATAEAVQKGKLKVWARFRSSYGKGKIQVRTRCENVDMIDVIQGDIAEQNLGMDIVGNVPTTTIFFDDSGYSIFRGKHTYVPLTLENPLFPEKGVGVYDFNWVWEFRAIDRDASFDAKKEIWKEEWFTVRTMNTNIPLRYSKQFELTKHRVYITLDLPSSPWSTHRIPDISRGIPISMPMWAHALEVACTWAAGATRTEDAAKMIADHFYASGLFKYHPSPKYGSLHKRDTDFGGIQLQEREDSYVAYFHMDKLLERLGGGFGLGEKVNCFDIALSIATLANLLGCRLRVGKFQYQPDIDAGDADHYLDNRFEINPIRAIGYESHEEVIGGVNDGEKSFFAYHSVAWAPAPGEEEQPDFTNPSCKIYDASLEIYTDDAYYSISGVEAGNAETPTTYVRYLSPDTVDGRPRCLPQPITVSEIQIIG